MPAGVGEHHPDALARVVGEEETVLIGRRVGRPGVEGETRRRGAARRAAFAGNDLGAVVVRVDEGS